jgi:hypothetical protein
MGAVEAYRERLLALPLEEWDSFLLAESRLPGRRANIELGHAVALEGDAARFERYLALDAGRAPANTPGEFLAFCGVLGLGRLVAAGERPFSSLRPYANDARWRLREAVAMALQGAGQVDPGGLEAEMRRWADGSYLEQRAAAAGLCEPELLAEPQLCRASLDILDSVTGHVARAPDRSDEAFRTLRQGLAYCWSVAVAACPNPGKGRFERWLASSDSDVRWILRENLQKKRLANLDAAWVARCQAQLAAG